MTKRGDHISIVCKREDASKDMIALLWVDRERCYFISTVSYTLPGQTIYRERWRRVSDETEKVIIKSPISHLCQTYYSAAFLIGRHNRCRQDDVGLEKKFQVQEWFMYVNTSLLAICIVDSWLLYKDGQGSRGCISPYEFYSMLAKQQTGNKYSTIFPAAKT